MEWNYLKKKYTEQLSQNAGAYSGVSDKEQARRLLNKKIKNIFISIVIAIVIITGIWFVYTRITHPVITDMNPPLTEEQVTDIVNQFKTFEQENPLPETQRQKLIVGDPDALPKPPETKTTIKPTTNKR